MPSPGPKLLPSFRETSSAVSFSYLSVPLFHLALSLPLFTPPPTRVAQLSLPPSLSLPLFLSPLCTLGHAEPGPGLSDEQVPPLDRRDGQPGEPEPLPQVARAAAPAQCHQHHLEAIVGRPLGRERGGKGGGRGPAAALLLRLRALDGGPDVCRHRRGLRPGQVAELDPGGRRRVAEGEPALGLSPEDAEVLVDLDEACGVEDRGGGEEGGVGGAVEAPGERVFFFFSF